MSLCATRVTVSFSCEIVHICKKLHVSQNGTSNPQKGPAAHFTSKKPENVPWSLFFLTVLQRVENTTYKSRRPILKTFNALLRCITFRRREATCQTHVLSNSIIDRSLWCFICDSRVFKLSCFFDPEHLAPTLKKGPFPGIHVPKLAPLSASTRPSQRGPFRPKRRLQREPIPGFGRA